MKRLLIPLVITLAILLPAATVHAQQSSVYLGVTWTSLDLPGQSGSTPEFTPEPRLTLGVARGFSFTDRLGLQLGFRFAQADGRIDIESRGSGSLETSYLEMSALGEAEFPLMGDRLTAYLQTGPVVTSKPSCRLNATAGPWASGGGPELDCYATTGLRYGLRDQLGWGAGGGLRLRLFGGAQLGIGLRHTYGLMGAPRWTIGMW